MKDWHESQESWARLVAELRAELDDLRCDDSCSRTVEELQARAWDAEAAIARVREACEAHRHGLMSPCAVDIVLEALDGGSE